MVNFEYGPLVYQVRILTESSLSAYSYYKALIHMIATSKVAVPDANYFVDMDSIGDINPGNDRIEHLDVDLRSKFEHVFGEDLSMVRIHTGPYSNNIARKQNAEALTIGNDIYFRDGTFLPHTEEGIALLAHELQHVIQYENNARMVYLEDLSELEAGASRVEEKLHDKNLFNLSRSELKQNSYSSQSGGAGGSEGLRKGVGEKGSGTIDDFRDTCKAPAYRIYFSSGKTVVLTVEEKRRFVEMAYQRLRENIQDQIAVASEKDRNEILMKYMSMFSKG